MGQHDMTKPRALAFVEGFKDAIDKAWNDLGEPILDVDYKKVGGLHHWRIGRLGGSLYVKKAKAQPKPEPVTAQPVTAQTEVRNWQERMKIGTGASGYAWTPLED